MMALCHLLAFVVAALPVIHGMKQPPAPAPAVAGDGADNAMTNTYGFLRKSSNNVGNAVESILGIEGSLDDMHKDLDEEYKRWLIKKKVLVGEQDKMKSLIDKAKGDLLLQKNMEGEKRRLEGRVEIQKADNKRQSESNKDEEKKWKMEKLSLEDELKAIQCQTKNVQKVKQERVNAANTKSFQLKDQNRLLQQQVFQLNKDLMKLNKDAADQKIANKNVVSGLLSEIEGLQKQIHGLETELLAQAQLEEMVQRARERVLAQTEETVKQRGKIKEAQDKCLQSKAESDHDIEAAKSILNQANREMGQCQNLDGENQKLQAMLNQCVLKKRSMR